MIQRFDNIAVDFPEASDPSPNSAAAVQELMGGKFGEMSTLMNYTFQSFNFRGREKYRPFYDLISNIASEEFSHIEAVAYAINLLLTGSTTRSDRNVPGGKNNETTMTDAIKNVVTSGHVDPAPLKSALDARNSYHFIASGQTALPVDSMGNPWNGSYVVSTGNLKMDLLHNFFLECGARANKMRVYDMTDHPVARALVGYLLVRGGVHVVAYAKALEKLTGVNVGGLLPIPDVSNKKYPEAARLEKEGLHTIMYKFSPTAYNQLAEIWNGPHPEDGQELIVKDEMPKAYPYPDLPEEPQLSSPGDIDPEMLKYYAGKLG